MRWHEAEARAIKAAEEAGHFDVVEYIREYHKRNAPWYSIF
jgi:hypothetical protein